MGTLLDNVRKSLFGDPVLPPPGTAGKVEGAGTAFAVLIERVGTAVAKTQAELDATSGHIATEMAKTEVETVQAVVTNYDDSGKIVDVKIISGKTSALAIAVPPALSFKRVHLEGSFVATEFAAAQHSNVNVNLMGFSVSTKGFRGSAGASFVNANTDVQTEQTQDTSVAAMSMTAQIRPKPVTALPKPALILTGPKLTLSLFNSGVDIIHQAPSQPADPPYLERRRALVNVKLTDAAGAVMQNKPKTIAIDCGTLDWVVSDQNNNDLTTGPITDNTTGDFYIKVSRTATASTDPKQNFVIRASLNLVNTSLSISL